MSTRPCQWINCSPSQALAAKSINCCAVSRKSNSKPSRPPNGSLPCVAQVTLPVLRRCCCVRFPVITVSG
ncbi:hypothetical protein KPSA3_04891 [Pseudomonas syringae pv. actinidiae]|uniref:Uncharacterized protein n=1 Tax=Pseudomonas syringae pv. actinidiae TaxID=103796 RepID=A0AAN4Q7V4_PSESF|nr:hypothetical protein KPSA3_04891 [Pseudomonas syringae pv. actinidiae]